MLTTYARPITAKHMSFSNRHKQRQLQSKRSSPLAKANSIRKSSRLATQIPSRILFARCQRTGQCETLITTEPPRFEVGIIRNLQVITQVALEVGIEATVAAGIIIVVEL